MRIAAGDVSRHLYFVAVDAADLKTRRTSLTNPAVWYSRDGGAKTDLSSPTVQHLANGVFKLALNQADMVAAAGDCCELVLHITADEMAPVTRVVEIVAQTEKDNFDRLGAPAGASLAADIATVDGVADSIAAKTTNLPAQPAAVGSEMALAAGAITAAKFGAGAISAAALAADAVQAIQNGLSTLTAAQVNAQADLALNDYDPPTAAELTAAISPLALEATLTAIKGTGWSDETLVALQALIDAVKAKTANLPAEPAAVGSRMDLVDAPNSVALGAIADAVLDEEVQSAAAAGTNLRAAAKAAWAQGFGRWVLFGTTLTLYGPDGSTPVRAFTLNDAENPTARTPV